MHNKDSVGCAILLGSTASVTLSVADAIIQKLSQGVIILWIKSICISWT